MAVCAAFQPRLPDLLPQRSMAWSRFSAATMPSTTGMPVARLIWVNARATWALMSPACDVAPWMTAPSAIKASCRLAAASFSSETSTAITLAPSADAIWTADRPTPPQPCTATHCPPCTWPWSTTAWNDVM